MKILIVDDSETLRSQLRKDLESKGYHVIEASDGSEGLATALKHEDIKLMFVDVNMPIMDGITMLKSMKEESILDGVPRLMLTTEANSEIKVEGKKAGVVAWVLKPYKKEQLLGAVETILARFSA